MDDMEQAVYDTGFKDGKESALNELSLWIDQYMVAGTTNRLKHQIAIQLNNTLSS